MNPVTIIGGGIAGLSLGIGLRRQGVPVRLCEAGHYPRHRVCGELISGHGQEVLAALGLRERLEAAGACLARTVRFCAPGVQLPIRILPTPALCLSRHVLDPLLARELVDAGGELQTGHRWSGDFAAPGVVRATGRRIHPPQAGGRWLGLKVHAERASLTADLEMHLFPGRYIGLCRLADGIVNVCGLFRSAGPTPALAREWPEWLRGPEGSALRARLGEARFLEETFCSISGFSLEPERAATTSECRIGDTLTVIPPVTGNGMSIALESAALATAPLVEFSRGALAWAEARARIANACDRSLARRLRWAGRLQWSLMAPAACQVLARATFWMPWLQRWLFHLTR